jgi:hypothetical protein
MPVQYRYSVIVSFTFKKYDRGPVNRRFLRTKNGPAGKSETEKPAAGKREAGQSGEPGQYKT